ncbi:hypothetical protein INS49_015798 [Diaporthe citri]|uniref:uncharacterized protein n=1 Tax=Diaporthe citri TaxID=83186 RepID=UPI001C810923|nr:uncharacterized protein INS49_015798 [Diaporthe citri]KAG6356410.1 hypothetical protein INS49_015798 [Diaporthe citri]
MMAGALPRAFRPQTLEEYVMSYGEVSQHIQYDYRPHTTTKGAVARPEHRLAPEIIRPWSSFDGERAILWNAAVQALSGGSATFPSQDHILETGSELALIDCEAAVHLCDTDLVHKPVSRILRLIGRDAEINSSLSRAIGTALGTRPLEMGHFFFSTHRNQLNDVIPQIAGSKRKLDSDATPDRHGTEQQSGHQEQERGEVLHLHMSREAAEQQFRAGPTDGLCNFKGDTDTRRILFAYELKAPHKLPWRTLQSAGLANNDRAFDVRQDIWEKPDDEAAGDASDNDAGGSRGIERTGQDEDDDSDPLSATAGVITQLYDFMIRERLRYGYISTSDCYIFLRIDLESPTIVEYYTARRPQPADALPPMRMLPLVRILLLALISLVRGGAIPADTALRATKEGSRWPVIRRAMTETTEGTSLIHNVGRESTGDKSFRQSTASNTSGSNDDHLAPNCLQAGYSNTDKPSKRKHDDGNGSFWAPEAGDGGWDPDGDRGKPSKRLKTTADRLEASAAGSLPTPPAFPHSPGLLLPPPPTSIVKLNDPNDPEVFRRAPYCTFRCIFGVVCGGSLDLDCPNRSSHPVQHPPTSVFRELLRRQLAEGPSCHALWVGWSGSTATIFKIRLASLGYVLVAKASSNRVALRTEERIYRKYLVPAQQSGAVAPCLGLLDLPEPWPDPDVYSDHLGHDLTCCLLLGWIPGKQPQDALCSSVGWSANNLSLSPSQKEQKQRARMALRASVRAAFEYIHSLRLVHGDAALRNLRVESSHPEGPFRAVLFDFEAAEHCDIWWERLQQKSRRRRRRRRQISADDKEVLFQAACEQEITQCLADVDMLY